MRYVLIVLPILTFVIGATIANKFTIREFKEKSHHASVVNDLHMLSDTLDIVENIDLADSRKAKCAAYRISSYKYRSIEQCTEDPVCRANLERHSISTVEETLDRYINVRGIIGTMCQ